MLFGEKMKMVQACPGSADKKIPIESGELDGDCCSWTSLPLEWLRIPSMKKIEAFRKNCSERIGFSS